MLDYNAGLLINCSRIYCSKQTLHKSYEQLPELVRSLAELLAL